MSLVVKLVCCMALLVATVQAQARDIYILVVGEGAAANCNAHPYGEVAGVMQIDRNGKETPASDPLDWADCKGGSIWIPLGQALIAKGMARKVVFMPVALYGTRVRDWLPGGRGGALLARAIKVANEQHIKFDYAFWQQGYSDRHSEVVFYRNDMRQLIQSISLQIKIGRWLFAQGGGCIADGAPAIASVQKEIVLGQHLRRFAGPDFSQFFSADLGDACNFTASGQQKAAQWWLESMKRADHANNAFQKESLLYYFK